MHAQKPREFDPFARDMRSMHTLLMGYIVHARHFDIAAFTRAVMSSKEETRYAGEALLGYESQLMGAGDNVG